MNNRKKSNRLDRNLLVKEEKNVVFILRLTIFVRRHEQKLLGQKLNLENVYYLHYKIISMCPLFQQVILSVIVVLNCSSLSIAKPFPLTRNQAFTQQSREQENELEDAAFQSDESRNQESDVTRGVVGFFNMPSAHNRTARAAGRHCVFQIDRKLDHCRKKLMNKVQCLGEDKTCIQAIPKYGKPLCRTVFGFREAKYSVNCTSIPIDCQSAA